MESSFLTKLTLNLLNSKSAITQFAPRKKTLVYVTAGVFLAMLGNAVDSLPLIGELTSLVGLIAIFQFCTCTDFRSAVVSKIKALELTSAE